MVITIDEAISQLTALKRKKITLEEIGTALGTSKQYISQSKNKILTEEQKDKIEDYFCEKLTEVNKENLENKKEDCLNLPVLGEVSASMGTGIQVYDESQTGVYKISAKVLKDIGANPKETDIIFAEGDSMEPTIQGGSALIVDKSKTEVKDGKIYCINFNGALMAKRLQLLPPKKLRVISDNFNKYPAWDVDFSKDIDFDFKVIGEVMRWMTNAR